MAKDPLEGMTVKELKTLSVQIDQAIAGRQESEKAALRQQLETIAGDAGYDLADLVGSKRGGRKGSVVAVKFCNPQDPLQTWTGRGRQPRWLVEKLAQGKKLESFKI